MSANTIIAPSPDKGHLGEFGKTLNLVKLYNAAPTLEETLVYSGYFGVAAERTKQLFQEFGGVLRKVLATDAQIADHRKQRISAIADQQLVRTFFKSGVLAETERAKPLSHILSSPTRRTLNSIVSILQALGLQRCWEACLRRSSSASCDPRSRSRGFYPAFLSLSFTKLSAVAATSTFDLLVTQLQSLWPPFRYLSCSKRL